MNLITLSDLLILEEKKWELFRDMESKWQILVYQMLYVLTCLLVIYSAEYWSKGKDV